MKERCQMKKYEGNYYLGLDIGTNSVGYAVTDENYNVLKFKKKSMWGSRLFDEADSAEARRIFRANRRRIGRRKWRIELLQDIFAEEICKIDPGFYQRLKDSMLWPEDKKEHQIYSLFSDEDFSDADFYKKYPTIYHLRKALMIENHKFDIRLVYLAVHHIVKHRGHFLFNGSFENATSFSSVFMQFVTCMKEEMDVEVECLSEDVVEEYLKDTTLSKKDKNSRLMQILQCDKSNKSLKAAIGLLSGLTVKLADLFEDKSLSDIEKPSICFASGSYEELRAAIEPDLQEKCIVIDTIKALYDWSVLADVLKEGKYQGRAYLSVAKTNMYDKHSEDLELLKNVIKEKDKELYRDFFQREGKDNYSAYVGFTSVNGVKKKVKKCSYDDLKKNIKKILQKEYGDSLDSRVEYILKELDQESFLPLQVSKNNAVIPYQVNEVELKKILENASQYYSFFNEEDENGISAKEKIIKIFKFRVPYFVGPINTVNNKNAWAVRKQDGSVMPWNIEEKIDFDQSGETFIRRMTNKCTYLIGKDVLPKNSLLYSAYMVWNEINNIRLGNDKIDVALKKKLFENVYKKRKHVKRKDIENFLLSEGINLVDMPLSGIDISIKASLISYHDFKKIFGHDIEKYTVQQMVEEIICWITVFGSETGMLKRIIRKKYDEQSITNDQLKKILRLRYQGWGRFSREFLNGIEGVNRETGEIYTIISALRDTTENLNQLLSYKYTFSDVIQEENGIFIHTDEPVTYQNYMEKLMASPAVKRASWQAILIAQEIKKIMGKDPEKVFVEMTRKHGEKQRTTSRKDQLLDLYKHIEDNEREWVQEISSRDEKDFRSIKLYLYYTQMGRSMYTGKPIDLNRLDDTSVYDRNHIFPRSLTKDDSIDNLVLVEKKINLDKGNGIVPSYIQEKRSSFWKILLDKGLITKKKYERLTRRTPLTEEELAHFINRQIVETSQSSKISAALMGRLFPNSKIVYVKAGTVSDFRQDNLQMIKVRSINDLHHAKDAYLNIVVGNVYYEKFTNNPLKWLKEGKDRKYNLTEIFKRDLIKNGKTIWKGEDNSSLENVRNQMLKNDIQYTRYATINKSGQNGGFFDQNPVGKDQNPGVPLKKGMDMGKYGGYKTVTPAYFALIESEGKKGKIQRSVEAVPLYLKRQFEEGSASFEKYCEDVYGLKNPKIIIRQIKKDSYWIINHFPMHLRGTTGKQLVFQSAVQLCLNEDSEQYVKKIENYIRRNQERTDKKELLPIVKYDGITKEKNVKLYMEFCGKLKNTIYKYRPNNQMDKLIGAAEKFKQLSCEEQCVVLSEILWLFRCKPNTMANLQLLGGSTKAGKIAINKVISNNDSVIIKNQSVTGLYEQTIDLLKL